jgi:lipoate-protein ligase A
MSQKLRVLISQSHNPWFNLATEEWIFRDLDPSLQTLFLWRNSETVVIGRNQNPWSECNLTQMEKDKVFLARRSSGGGAVFQDLGNTCFTFLSPKASYSRDNNNAIVLKALQGFDITAQASGRNDIVVPQEDGPRKISGSAFHETRDRAFHHGTLLMNTNLTRLANYLTPHPKKLSSKGKASVRSRVMNLSELAPDIRHETLSPKLIESFSEHYRSEVSIENLDEATLRKISSLQSYFEKLSDWDWRFGKAPQFHQELAEYLSWGFVQIFIDADQGRIERAQVFSDALYPQLIESLQKYLVKAPYTQTGVATVVAQVLGENPQHSEELKELEAWLKTQVETL